MSKGYFSQDEYKRRWGEVHTAMVTQGLDTAVVWGRSAGTYERCGDVLYLVNYYGNMSGQGLDTPISTARGIAAVILRRGQTPELQADEPLPRTDLIATDRVQWSRNTVKAVADSLQASGTNGRVGLVGTDFFPMKYWRQLESMTSDIEWVPADDLIRELRKYKSKQERDALRRGGEIATAALDVLIKALLAGETEAEAAGQAAREVFRGGGHVHMIPISHGEHILNFVSEPIAAYNHESARQGDIIRGWVYGPMFQGYWIDPGRTTVRGRPTNSQKEMIETCGGIVEKCIAAIRPGVEVQEVARLGERLFEEAGGEKDQAAEKFPIYGHGIGLFFEKPYISTTMGEPGDVFEENMAFGVEAFLARTGVGSAGFEQNILVTAEGIELLTTSPMYSWD